MHGDDAPVVPRVGHEENHHTDPEVAGLGERLPLKRLDVGEMGLGLDKDLAERAHDHGVGTASVAHDWNWDFEAPRDVLAKPLPKPSEQGKVCSIADRIAVGVQPNSELQAEHRCDPRSEVNRQRAGITAQGALNPVRADA